MGFSSQAGRVILKTQATPGTYDPDTGDDGLAVYLRGGTLGPNRELLIPDPEIGGGRDVVDALLGAVSWGGDYEFYARSSGVLTLLNAVCGDTDTAVDTPVAGVNEHTVTPLDSATLPFLSIEEAVGGVTSPFEVFRYHDAVVNTFHLEADANGYLQGTAGIIAARQLAGATATAAGDVTYDENPLMVGTNISVVYNSVTLPAKSFSLDINNNFEDDDFRLGSFYLGDLTAKRREITASFNLREASSAMWRQAVYGTTAATSPGGVVTKNALVITMTSYEMIGATATPFRLQFTFPKFALTPYALAISGDDIIENDLEGQALRPSAATPSMTVTVRNALAAVV